MPSRPAMYTIVQDKVAMAPMCAEEEVQPVYVWDLSSNHVQEIGSFSNLKLWHVDVAENVLVAFEIDLLKKYPPEVHQTKWTTTTGKLLEEKIFHLPLPVDLPLRRLRRLHINRHPCHTYGHKTVTQLFVKDKYGTIHLEYDNSIDRLSARWIRVFNPLEKDVIRYSPVFLTPYLVYRWTFGADETTVYNAGTGRITLHSVLDSSTKSMLEGFHSEPHFSDISGHRQVICFANNTGVLLLFFNPNFAPNLVPDREK